MIGFLGTHGVAQTRVTAVGLADERPVGDNATDTGRQANRRVEIQISANEKLQQEQAAQQQGQTTAAAPPPPPTAAPPPAGRPPRP